MGGLDETPIQFSNVVISQFQPGEFIISFGQIAPPVIPGRDDAERQKALGSVDYLPIRPIARLGLTRNRLVELIAALQENLENHDRAVARKEGRLGND